jgi:hypothetical protein
MPPSKASSQPPSRTVLAQPRAQVEEKIEERIRHGEEMQNRSKSNLADSVKYVADVQKWRNFNLTFCKTRLPINRNGMNIIGQRTIHSWILLKW